MDTVNLIESIIRALMCLLGILGNNWLAIHSLPRKKSRLRTNEALLLNLAVSNLITNVLVDMPDTMSDFAGRWFLGKIYCKVFQFCSYLSETNSIFSTLLISIFWYQKLVGSLKHGGAPVKLDNLRLVAVLLAGGWAVSIVFSIPCFISADMETYNQTSAHCKEEYPERAKEIYKITYLTVANAVPISGIFFASTQIVITLLRHQKRIQGISTNSAPSSQPHRAEESKPCEGTMAGAVCTSHPRPSKPTPSPGTQVRAAKSVVAVASIFLICWLTHLLLVISSNVIESSLVVDIATYIAASYTSIIPYIFLYGLRKLSCSCCG